MLLHTDPRLVQGPLADLERLLDERIGDRAELGPGHREVETEGFPADAEGDIDELDRRALLGRELQLQLLGRLADVLEDLLVRARIVEVLRREPLGDPVGDRGVDVVAAEVAVARGGADPEDVPLPLEERHVERAAAEVVDEDPLLPLLAVAIRERRGGRLVEDAEDLEPREAPGELRRGPLEVVEVRGAGDDGAIDLLLQRHVRDRLRLPEHERADLGERVLLVSRDDEDARVLPLPQLVRQARARLGDLLRPPRPTDEALRAEDRVLRVLEPPLLRLAPDEHGPRRVKRTDARDQRVPRQIARSTARARSPFGDREVRDDGVRGSEVDPDGRGVRSHRIHARTMRCELSIGRRLPWARESVRRKR